MIMRLTIIFKVQVLKISKLSSGIKSLSHQSQQTGQVPKSLESSLKAWIQLSKPRETSCQDKVSGAQDQSISTQLVPLENASLLSTQLHHSLECLKKLITVLSDFLQLLSQQNLLHSLQEWALNSWEMGLTQLTWSLCGASMVNLTIGISSQMNGRIGSDQEKELLRKLYHINFLKQLTWFRLLVLMTGANMDKMVRLRLMRIWTSHSNWDLFLILILQPCSLQICMALDQWLILMILFQSHQIQTFGKSMVLMAHHKKEVLSTWSVTFNWMDLWLNPSTVMKAFSSDMVSWMMMLKSDQSGHHTFQNTPWVANAHMKICFSN